MKAGRSCVRLLLRAGVLVLVVAVTGACTSGSTGAGAKSEAGMVAQDPSGLAGSRWQAVEVGSVDVDAGVPSTLAFEPPGRVSGNSGCNRYFGTADVGAGSVRFGPLAATRMMCPSPRMEQETRFLEALAKVERWRIDDDARLVLADAAGTPLIVFEREHT